MLPRIKSLLILLMIMSHFSCEKHDSAGRFQYSLLIENDGLVVGQESISQNAQEYQISTGALASGVVSGYGYNEGLYVLSYARIQRNGENRDVYLSFDIPIYADMVLQSNQHITGVNDLFAELLEEKLDGTNVYLNQYPIGGDFWIEQLYLNNEGIAGVSMRFEIDFGDRKVSNGVFKTKDSAQTVKTTEENKNKNNQ
jgi:hypothetical protein